eukprot:GHVQ01008235.1.p1 GENE.GHVQ01008235.1~~GHVQ01008235.1.p1  ORF type:complete len:149 (-),score=17.87 GHVQ01008235.1:154-600(-)
MLSNILGLPKEAQGALKVVQQEIVGLRKQLKVAQDERNDAVKAKEEAMKQLDEANKRFLHQQNTFCKVLLLLKFCLVIVVPVALFVGIIGFPVITSGWIVYKIYNKYIETIKTREEANKTYLRLFIDAFVDRIEHLLEFAINLFCVNI